MSKEVTQTASADTAAWFDGKTINEALFCEEFLRDYPMISVGGTFFTVNGLVNDEIRLEKEIYTRIKPYVTTNLSKRVKSLLDVMRIECCTDDLLLYQDRIHVANGTYHLDGTFSTEKDYCRNRLPVAYNPEAPQPVTWLHFLSQLLEPEDILTVQEFIGYCFVPSTKGQKMLMLTGKGGEGKSRIGVVLRALLGVNMKTGSLQKVETNNYARADLEHELLMLDDDMKLEALPQTNIIKAIITAELPMDLERKRQQSYQGDMYVRFIGFGSGVLQALHDRSVGFFRRQIILTTKDKDPNRKDDPYIAEKMVAEAEGIFLWALEGLHRLITNDFQFTLSQSALDNLNDAVSDGNNMIDFLASEGYIRFRADYEASSRNLYAVYKQWCEDNALSCLCQKSFCSFLKQNESRYNIEYTNKINIGGGRFARGFVGIEILQRPFL